MLAFFFVPGFRGLFVGALFLVVIAGGVALMGLIAWVVYRLCFQQRIPEVSSAQSTDRSFVPSVTKPSMSRDWSSDSALSHEIKPATFPIQTFSRELLDALEWRRFEELVTLYFLKTGYVAKRSRVGADGGVDILLYRQGEQQPFAFVQCKAWHAFKVGVKPVRELFGVMAAEKISKGYFVTTGDFTSEALAFAESKSLKLVTGDYLLEKFQTLPQEVQAEIIETVTRGDYTTPTCPHCDIKMVNRHSSSGDFWGCLNYSRPWPNRCKQTFKLRDSEAT
jgi:restriction system protein